MYTTCRVGVLSSEISKHSKISPPPSLRNHLTSSPMGVFSGDYTSDARVDNIHVGGLLWGNGMVGWVNRTEIRLRKWGLGLGLNG